MAAVRGGQGIHNGPLWAFADLIAAGAVEQILPDYRQEAFPLYAVRRPSIIVPARITDFVDFLQTKIAKVPGPTPLP